MKKILVLLLFCMPFIGITQNSYIINTVGMTFSPSSLTINVGDTVIWNNTGGSHNVNATQATFPNNPEGFGNGVAASPWSFKWVFTIAGIYDYQCDPHATGMSGVIIVNTPSSSLSISNNDTIICLGDVATVIGTTSVQASTDSYQITNITFAPETIAGTAISLSDDDVQGPFSLGFTFQFYGNNYTEFYVGSNGWIGFTSGQDPYNYFAVPIPDTSSIKNCIMLSWQDLNPSTTTGGGQVLYQTIGTAPNRKMVLTFDAVPYYTTTIPITSQVVLYEGSNVIDNHTIDKPFHTGAFPTVAVQGIHNLLGTSATVVPGRNATIWEANQESVRYFPSGISWYDVNTGQMVGNGDTLLYAPNQSTYIRAEIIDSTGQTYSDSMYIEVLNPNISSTGLSLCNGDLDLTAPTAFSTYIWNDQSTNGLLTVDTPGSYYVNSTTSNGLTCQSDTITIYSGNIPITLSTPASVSICQGDTVTIDGPTGFSQYSWSTGETTSSITTTLTGNYSLSVIDSNLCAGTSGTTSVSIFPSTITATTTGLSLCNGPVTLDAGLGFASYEWYENGFMMFITTQTLSVTWPGDYHVEVTYPTGCIATSDTLTILSGTTPISFTIDSVGAGSLCLPNGQVTLDAGNYATYSWSPGGQTTQQISVNTEGSYSVDVIDADGCQGSSSTPFVVSNIVNTSVITGPITPPPSQNVIYSVDPSVGSSYNWTLVGGTFTGQGTNSINVTWNSTGGFSFSVIETDINGCVGEEVFLLVNVVTPSWDCTGGSCIDPGTGAGIYSSLSTCQTTCIETSVLLENIANFTIYPNPTKDNIIIQFTNLIHQDIKISIINSIGEVVFFDNLVSYIGNYTEIINLTNNTKGIYFLEIETNDGIINKKLILQ